MECQWHPQGWQVSLQQRGCMIHKRCGEATKDCPQPSKASKCWGHQWDTLISSEVFLSQKGLEHDHLLEMIPQVPDVQAAWLLLVFCASTRANFFLRTVAPEFTLEFAERHDEQVYTLLEKRTPALNFIHLFRLWKGKLHVGRARWEVQVS